jgi:RNA-binding protein
VDLTTKQKRHLRALAHHLNPVVQVGQHGLTDAVVAKVDAELEIHELIKVKVSKDAPADVDSAAVTLAERAKAGVAQVIGRTVVLYRRRKEKPEIQLP